MKLSRPGVVDLVVVEHAQELDALVLVLEVRAVEGRDLLLARAAPGRPEVHDDDLAGQRLVLERLLVDVGVVDRGQALVGGRARGLGRLGGGVARHQRCGAGDQETESERGAADHRNLTSEGASSVGAV
jgi:hypothetical protein